MTENEFYKIKNTVKLIIKELENKECLLTDNEILKNIEIFNNALQTNCQSAAVSLFSFLSSICYFHSTLEKELISIAIEPLYWLGIDKTEGILKWVKCFLVKKEYHYELAKSGEKWLKNTFFSKKDLIEIILYELKALTYIQTLLKNATWSDYNKNVIIEIVNYNYKSFSTLFDLQNYLQEEFKKKLSELVPYSLAEDIMDKDSQYLINRELKSYTYKGKFNSIGWIIE